MLLWRLILSQLVAAQSTNGTTTGVVLYDNSPPLISKGNIEGAPNATKYHFTKVNFENADQNITIIVFKIDFDRNIFLTNTKNPSENVSLTDDALQVLSETQNVPQISVAGKDTVELICDGKKISGEDVSTQNGLPSNYIISPPTTDPGSTLLNTLFKGAKINETLVPNRFAMIYAGPLASTFNQNTKCTVKFTSNGSYKVTGFKGDSPIGNLTLALKPPQCRYEDVIALKKFAVQLIEYGSNNTGKNQVDATSQLIGALSARESFAGCKGLINSWLKFTIKESTVKNSKECLVPYEDPKWEKDPCCNQKLQNSMCCLPKDKIISLKMIESVSSDVILKMCSNPNKVSAILSNAAEASKNDKLEPFDSSAVFNAYYEPIRQCFNTVFQTKCTTDTDCAYSGKCSQNGFCAVDFINPGPALVKCFLLNMDPELLLQFQTVLGIPTLYDTIENSIGNTTAKILQVASIEDCAGPKSERYRKKTIWVRNKSGNFVQEIERGNKDGCLADKECSFQPWKRTTQELCLAGKTEGRTGFCGQCDGSICNSITQFSTCMAMGLSPGDCIAVGGVMNNGQCEFPKRSTAALCLTGLNCDSSTNELRCGRTICAKTTIKTETECKGVAGYIWATPLNLCIKGKWNNQKDSCDADSSTFVPGVTYRKGFFETQSDCPATTCDNMQSVVNGGDYTECTSTGYCTAPCARCRSDKYDGGVCVVSGILDLDTCQSSLGTWQQNNCFSSKDKATCTGSNEKWLDCGTLTTEEACKKDIAINNVINCRWNAFDTCKTKELCVSGGSCNDFEFGNGFLDGVCIYKTEKCASMDRKTRAGDCIMDAISTSAQCDSKGGKWTTRSKTKEACVALGNECSLGNGMHNNMDVETCNSCLGKSSPQYQWTTPRWKTGQMVPTSWRPIEWKSINTWSTVFDQDKLMELLQGAAYQIIARKKINRFKQQFSLYNTIFEYVSCDCLTNSTSCFSKEDIKAPLVSCNADPAATSACGGVEIVPGTFPNGTSVSIDVQFVSSASYVNEAANLLKRDMGLDNKRAASTFGAYEVVKNGDGSVIGQIVGNGKSFSFGTMPESGIKICLDVDPNISQDNSKYPKLDFAKSIDSSLDVPLGITVTLVGAQYCGTVPAFKTGIFVPVIRKEVTLTGSREKAAGTSTAVNSKPSLFFALIVSVLATL